MFWGLAVMCHCLHRIAGAQEGDVEKLYLNLDQAGYDVSDIHTVCWQTNVKCLTVPFYAHIYNLAVIDQNRKET